MPKWAQYRNEGDVFMRHTPTVDVAAGEPVEISTDFWGVSPLDVLADEPGDFRITGVFQGVKQTESEVITEGDLMGFSAGLGFSVNGTGPWRAMESSSNTQSYVLVGINVPVPPGAGSGTVSNLDYDAPTRTITNTGGNNAQLTLATTTDAGLMSNAQFDKLGFVTVTQAVNLDTIESDTATNNAKLTADETNVTNALDGATLTDLGVTGTTGDGFLVQDASDGNNLKKILYENLPSGSTQNLTWNQGTNTVEIDGGGTDAQITLAAYGFPGVVELATTGEVDAGTDNTRAVSPFDLASSVHAANETNVTNALDGATLTDLGVTGTTGDGFLVQDASDSNNLKKILWENLPSGGSSTLDGLTDTTITAVGSGEVLVWDGVGDWINNTLAEAGIAAASHTHAAADVDTGTFDNARIAQSNVTQHVAAIDHDSLLNFVANEHLDWTADLGATNVNVANITAAAVTQHEASIDHNNLLNSGGNPHIDWTLASQGTVHATNYNVEGTAVLSTGPVTDGFVLTADGAGGVAWEAVPGGGSPEGTSVLSTGETGTVKFLRTNGDNSSSWQEVPGAVKEATYSNGDLNPSVANGATYIKVSNTAAGVVIDDFDDPTDGQRLTVHLPAATNPTEIANNTNIYLNGAANFKPITNIEATLELEYDATLIAWREIGRMHNQHSLAVSNDADDLDLVNTTNNALHMTINTNTRVASFGGTGVVLTGGGAFHGNDGSGTDDPGDSLSVRGGDGAAVNSNGGDLLLFGGALQGTGADGTTYLAYDGTDARGVVNIGTPAAGYQLPVARGTNGQILKTDASGVVTWQADATGGAGVWTDEDPVKLATETRDVVVGTNQINTSKLSIDGDADQVQFSIQGHSTQTTDLLVLENNSETELFTVDNAGAVVAASTVQASNISAGASVSGSNTGDQTITLTGDVTGSGTGSFAATIAADSVTYDKMQDTTGTDVILGRSTAGAGTVEEISCTSAGRELINDADAAAQRTTLGVVIGTDVQAHDAQLDDIAALAVTDGNFVVGNGTNWVAESGATARTSIGLGNVENTQLSTWAGSTNITTLGTVTAGTLSSLTVTTPTLDLTLGTAPTQNGRIEYHDTNDTILIGDGTGTKVFSDDSKLVTKALYDANSIVYATTDDTPVALTVAASTFVGRKATGDISAMSATEARTVLNVADGAIATVVTDQDVTFDETVLGTTTGAFSIDMSTDLEHYGTLTGDSTVSLTNFTTNGMAGRLYLKNTTSETITASGFTWWSGTAPTLSSTKWTRIQFERVDGTIYAFASLQG